LREIVVRNLRIRPASTSRKIRWPGCWHRIPGGRSQRRCAYLCWQTGRHRPLPSPPGSRDRCSRESAPPGNQHSASAGPGKIVKPRVSRREDAEYGVHRRRKSFQRGSA
jgi:hypothetical protein